MQDHDKTQDQLIDELNEMRRRVAEYETCNVKLSTLISGIIGEDAAIRRLTEIAADDVFKEKLLILGLASELAVTDGENQRKSRKSTRGTGLGLSVVKGIVQQQGGHVTCESEPGKGTEFKVYFPAIEAPLMTAKTVVATAQSGGTETILVVEDNLSVAEFELVILENAGYTVIVVSNGKEALEIYRTRKDEISLVILDLLMPEMSGRDCLMELLKIDPSVKVLIASGYAPEDELHKEISPLVKGFLHKPFEIAELLTSVRSLMVID